MPQYRIAVTAELICSEPIDVTRLKLASRAKRVRLLSPSLVKVVFIRRGPEPVSAAAQAIAELTRALPPGVRLRRAPLWTARLRRVLVGAGVTTGSTEGFRPDEDDDDGLGGVREPRRPLPPPGSASMALELPDS